MRSAKIILAYVTILALSTCEWCERGPTMQEQVDAFNETGWQLFTESKFAAALDEFKEGLNMDPVNISGNVGRGWSLLMLDDQDQDTIIAVLEVGSAGPSADPAGGGADGWQNHAWCGLAVIKLNQLRYSEADSLAERVLTADSGYVFTYHEQIDWCDLLIIQAQVRFFAIDYDGAWQAVGPLLVDTPTLEVGFPDGNLDRADPNTWIVDGITFALYEEALAKVIHILAEKYRLE